MRARRSVMKTGHGEADRSRMGPDKMDEQVQEIILDYSHCWDQAPEYPATSPMPSNLVTMNFKKNSSNTDKPDAPTWSRRTITATYQNATTGVVHATVENTTQCVLTFPIPNNMDPPVLFYYRLTNFYQNHRRYAKSFDNNQLSGKAVSAGTIHSSDCTPLTTVTVNGTEIPYYPCGLAANSMFNDTFYNPVLLNVAGSQAANQTYVMQNNSGISWASDKQLYGPSQYNWADVAVPPNWVLRYPNNYSDNYHPDLENDEPFQVWMRLAGLPTFSKLAQRNDSTTMTAGTYSVNIDHRMSFPFPFPHFLKASLTQHRLQRNRVWRHKIYYYLHPHRGRWQEPLPRHRLCCSSRNLRRTWHAFHHHASHPATEIGRSYLPYMEQRSGSYGYSKWEG